MQLASREMNSKEVLLVVFSFCFLWNSQETIHENKVTENKRVQQTSGKWFAFLHNNNILYLISRGSVCMIFFIYFLVLLICLPTEYWSNCSRVGLLAVILHVKARSVENPGKTLKGANKSWWHCCKVLGYTVTAIDFCLYPYTKLCCRFMTM